MGLIVGLNSQHGLGLRSDGQKYTKASENNELEGKHIQSDSTLLGCRKRVVICNGMVVLRCDCRVCGIHQWLAPTSDSEEENTASAVTSEGAAPLVHKQNRRPYRIFRFGL